jgi:hypothetical protein
VRGLFVHGTLDQAVGVHVVEKDEQGLLFSADSDGIIHDPRPELAPHLDVVRKTDQQVDRTTLGDRLGKGRVVAQVRAHTPGPVELLAAARDQDDLLTAADELRDDRPPAAEDPGRFFSNRGDEQRRKLTETV